MCVLVCDTYNDILSPRFSSYSPCCTSLKQVEQRLATFLSIHWRAINTARPLSIARLHHIRSRKPGISSNVYAFEVIRHQNCARCRQLAIVVSGALPTRQRRAHTGWWWRWFRHCPPGKKKEKGSTFLIVSCRCCTAPTFYESVARTPTYSKVRTSTHGTNAYEYAKFVREYSKT